MPITLRIDATAFTNCLRVAKAAEEGRESVRLLQAHPNGALAATDGHVALVYPDAVEGAEQLTRVLGIPIDNGLPKVSKKTMIISVEVSDESDSETPKLRLRACNAYGVHIDNANYETDGYEGSIPAIKRAFPKATDIGCGLSEVCLRSDLLSLFPAGGVRLTFQVDPKKAVLVRPNGGSKWFGLIMPIDGGRVSGCEPVDDVYADVGLLDD